MTISNLYLTTNPSLLLDFANVKGLDPRVSFTRNSPATYWDSAGVLRTARANQPRFDHDPVTLESRGLLVEQSATNLLPGSQELHAWAAYQTFTQSNAALAPDGTQTATKVIPYTGVTFGSIYKILTDQTALTSYCGSVFMKAAGFSTAELQLVARNGGADLGRAIVVANLLTGSFTITSSGTAWGSVQSSVTDVGSGWYRVVISGYTPSTTNRVDFAPSITATGNDTSGFFVWGAQLELGTRATSYIQTQSTAVTREADVPVMTGTNFTRWYEAGEGTLVVQSATPDWGISTNVSLDDGTTINQILVNWDGISSPTATVKRNGSSQAQIQNAYTTANPDVTLVTTINNSSMGLAFNGVDVGTITSNTVPTVNQLRIGVDTPQAWFKRIMFYRQAKDTVKIRALSSSSNVAVDFEPISLFKSGEPGVWFDPSEVANLSWRRNLLTYTEQFDNNVWTKTNSTVMPNVSNAPIQGSTADKLIETITNTTHTVYQSSTVVVGQTYTFSLYAKAVERSTVVLFFSSASTGSIRVNLLTGSIENGSGTVSNAGNGWWRIALTSTTNGTSLLSWAQLYNGSGTYTGDGTSGILIWGAQLEVGSTATEYQRISDVHTEVRAFYPKTTLYQDTAGIQPVTTPGQSVALMLDKSRGLTRGQELIVNGDFSNGATGWDDSIVVAGGGTAVVSNGQAVITRGTSRADYYQIITTVIGKTYEFYGTVKEKTGTVSWWVGTTRNNASNLNLSGVSVGTHRGLFTATATSTYIVMVLDGTTGQTVTIDDISVRELPGNHATQATAASRPIYSVIPQTGRRNLLTYTEQMDNAAWAKASITVTANADISPIGDPTADLLVPSASSGSIRQSLTFAPNTQIRISFYLKAGTSTYSTIGLWDDTAAAFKGQNAVTWSNGVPSMPAGTGNATGAQVVSMGNGWYRCSVTMTSDSVNTSHRLFFYPDTLTGTGSVYIWGAQLETGSTSTAYQRVISQYDVFESSVETIHYLSFDGTDDFMVTSTITPNTDKVQVFAGVRKLSDANYPLVVEFSASANVNNGAFNVIASGATVNTAGWSWISRGTTSAQAQVGSGYVSPITNVLTGLGDIAGDVTTLRINGTQVAQSAADQGTGIYLSYPLYIGRRAGTTLPFNGHLYGLIARFGSNLNTSQITRSEQWLAHKTGLTL